MALLYARERASIQKARSTSAIPERNCRLNVEPLDFSQAEINGKLIIDNLGIEQIPVAGIFVRCEINEYVKIDTRFDGRAETKIRSENILAKESWATVYVLGEDSNTCKLTIPSRRSEYSFTFDLTDARILQFPASYKATYGNITYQIVAYIQRPYPDDKIYYQKLIAITPPHYPGYLNLSKDPISNNCILAEKSIQKSFFSKRTLFQAVLHVPKTGFLVGEDLPFTIKMNNISGETVTRASLSLVRRIGWKPTCTDSKNTLTLLDSKANKDIGRESEDVWSDTLKIPETIGPTAAGRAIEFQYFLRMEILLSERVPVKSETTILVGTTWGDARTDEAIRPKLTNVRQISTESAHSTISFPPNYSALSSRKPSIETCNETLNNEKILPPDYQEALDGGVKALELPSTPEEQNADE